MKTETRYLGNEGEQASQGDEAETPRRSRIGSKRRKRKPVLGLVPRIALIAMASVVVVFASCAFVAKIAQPYSMQLEQHKQMRALNTQLADLNASNDDLDRQIRYIQQPAGIETAARAQGYLKPGEISIVVDTKDMPRAARPEPTGFAGLIQKAWSHWTGKGT